MKQVIIEELNRMKYLFGHERGRVISEQNLLTEQATPKDQAEADAFRVYLNKPTAEGGAGVTFSCKPYGTNANLTAAPGRKFTGPCMKAAWAQYGTKFKESQTKTTDTTTTQTGPQLYGAQDQGTTVQPGATGAQDQGTSPQGGATGAQDQGTPPQGGGKLNPDQFTA